MANKSTPAAPPAQKGLGIADLCIKRPVFATMMNLLFVVLGFFSFQQIGVDQFPNIELPIITVTTTLRGASPEEMETSVTKPLEEIINTVQGIDELNSTTLEGVSRITVQFLLERNRDIAAQDVRDKVNTILSRLPPGTETPIIDKFDLDSVRACLKSSSRRQWASDFFRVSARRTEYWSLVTSAATMIRYVFKHALRLDAGKKCRGWL